MLKSFDRNDIEASGKIILYGAAMYGELALNALNECGVKVTAFCDRVQAGNTFCDLPVISPEELKQMPDAYVLICATKGFQGIKYYLEEINWKNYYEISNLLKNVNYEKLRPYCRQLPIQDLIEKYNFYVFDNKKETLDLSFLALSITERCTLKCKKCSVLAPYYEHPCDDDFQLITDSLSNLINCVDSIAELQIGGGEPFLHRNFKEILDWIITQDKVKEISIFTNSTIIPNEEVQTILATPKIKLLLDDYGKLSRNLDKIVSICEKKKIRYIIQKFERWDDLGDYSRKNYTEEQLVNMFKYCSFGNVMSLMKGKLYRCTTAARIADLGIVGEEGDYVSFLEKDYNVEDKRKEIRELIYNKKYHNGCRYCNGISTNKLGIPVAEQLKVEI